MLLSKSSSEEAITTGSFKSGKLLRGGVKKGQEVVVFSNQRGMCRDELWAIQGKKNKRIYNTGNCPIA